MCKLRNICTNVLHFLIIDRNFNLNLIKKQYRKNKTKNFVNLKIRTII